MSSILPAPGSSGGAGEAWRPTDFRFRVRCKSSRKFPPDPFLGEVGGDSGAVEGAVFFNELLDHGELLTSGGGGGACG